MMINLHDDDGNLLLPRQALIAASCLSAATFDRLGIRPRRKRGREAFYLLPHFILARARQRIHAARQIRELKEISPKAAAMLADQIWREIHSEHGWPAGWFNEIAAAQDGYNHD